MNISEWKWKTKDGVEIYSKAWEPEGKAKGVVCVMHGVGEHIGRYKNPGEALSAAGYVVAGFDIRGFGQSGGKRGHLPYKEAYFDDLDSFLAEVAKRYPSMPCFLYGHSMGGFLVLGYTPTRKPDVRGVIVTDPSLKTSIEEQKFKLFLVKTLGTLLPSMTLISGVDSKDLSRDSQVGVEYDSDPLVHKIVSLGWGKAMLDLIALAYKEAPGFPLPLLIMHGTEDRLSYPRGSTLYAELAPKDKLTLKMWEGFKHEIHNEPGKEDVFRYMIDWLEKLNK